MRNRIQFSNLKAEMARHDVSIQDMAKSLGITRDTLGRKLSGKSQINLDEAFKIQKKFFPEVSMQCLFKELCAVDSKTAS